MKKSNGSKGEKPKPEAAETNRDAKEEIMCWKDPNKVCRCGHPQQGIYCGRYPLATD